MAHLFIEHRAAIASGDQALALQRRKIPPNGHIGGVKLSGKLMDRDNLINPQLFDDLILTFYCNHSSTSLLFFLFLAGKPSLFDFPAGLHSLCHANERVASTSIKPRFFLSWA